MRVKFKEGEQRKFLEKVLEILNCPSLKELVSRGLSVNYSSLKNYFIEAYSLPEDLFEELIKLSHLDKDSLNYILVEKNWGQVKGGKVKFK